jgi:hypothetical protein
LLLLLPLLLQEEEELIDCAMVFSEGAKDEQVGK